MPAETTSALFLGPAQPYFGTVSAETTLGFTEGGLSVRLTDERADLKYDRGGTNPADSTQIGRMIEISMSLAEIDHDNITLSLPGSTKIVDGMDASRTKVNVPVGVGNQMTRDGFAKSLLIKPLIAGIVTTDEQFFVRFGAAAPRIDTELSYSRENQQLLALTFFAYPDDSDADLFLAIFGDENAEV